MRNVSYKNADSTRKCNSPSGEERQAASASEPFKPASMRGTDERLPQLTQEESYQIEALLKAGHPQSGIATVLKRDKPTISREVRRNCGLRGYRPKQAQRLALARREARAKPRLDPGTWEWVESLLCEEWSPEQLRADCRGAAGRVCQL